LRLRLLGLRLLRLRFWLGFRLGLKHSRPDEPRSAAADLPFEPHLALQRASAGERADRGSIACRPLQPGQLVWCRRGGDGSWPDTLWYPDLDVRPCCAPGFRRIACAPTHVDDANTTAVARIASRSSPSRLLFAALIAVELLGQWPR